MAKVNESLMEIARQCEEIREMASDPDVDIEVVMDSIESMEGVLEAKVNSYGFIYRDLKEAQAAQKARIDYLESEVKRMKDHLKALQNNEEKLKDRLMAAMIATGKDETGIHTEMFDIKVVGKGGQQELKYIAELVPDSFMKVTYSPDTEKIREYLKDHTCEWAKLLPRGKRIDIR